MTDVPVELLTPELIEKLSPGEKLRAIGILRRKRRALGLPDPAAPWGTDNPTELLRQVAPHVVYDEMTPEHDEIWRWVWNVQPGVRPRPLCAVLARGRGKSTTLELAAVLLLAHRRRRFVWYVSATQDAADKHVESIASVLESTEIARRYPGMGDPKVGKHGNQTAWRRTRLTTASGATIESIGLDKGVRGARVDEFRPDLIIFDDIDTSEDSPLVVKKKLTTITQAIIPAGSVGVAVVAIQNLVHSNSLVRRIVEPHLFPEDDWWMMDAKVIGPAPAVIDLETEQYFDEDLGRRAFRITHGTATWSGQPIDFLNAKLRDIGPLAFKREYQHSVDDQPGGMFSHITFRHCELADVPWHRIVATVVAVDPSVTSTTRSDAMGIQVDGVTDDGFIYRFYSWEAIATTTDAIERALLRCYEYKSGHLIVETNNGGDTWGSVFRLALRNLKRQGKVPKNWRPKLIYAKVGGKTSKADRAAAMEPEYARDEIIHVRGTHRTLESALYRFPLTEPDDLVDAAVHSWKWLRRVRGSPGAAALAGADRSGSWAPPSSGGSALTGPSGGRSGWALGSGAGARAGGFSWRDSGL